MIKGTGASPGTAIGRIVCIRENSYDLSGAVYQGSEEEKNRLKAAAESFCAETLSLAQLTKETVGESEAQILTGQIMMLQDPVMMGHMEELIESGSSAPAAVDSVCRTYIELFSQMEDELMSQRAADIADLRSRMLGLLLGVKSGNIDLPKGTILAAMELTPSVTVGLNRERVIAIATEAGGKTSHAAILAGAMGIPAVVGAAGLMDSVHDGMTAIVDGASGEIILSPDEDTAALYTGRIEQERQQRELLEIYRTKPTADADGRRFAIYANIGTVGEAAAALENSAEGIGLFRTEFLFMDRSFAPSEEEQLSAYKAVSEMMQGREVIIRTLDVGGDKAVGYLGMDREENPFLGHRAIRYCLSEKGIFKTQLRAILRAGAKYKNIKVMLPLVTGVQEIREAKAIIEECRQELCREGFDFDGRMKLGVMIETPAAALTADLMAREADFFSIGTNDLTQYTIAVDRGNSKVQNLYTHLSPAVLRSIRSVIAAAKERGIPVGMCGEAAADPMLIPLLISWGLDEFSVSPSAVLKTKKSISEWTKAQADDLTAKVMELSTAEEVRECLSKVCEGR